MNRREALTALVAMPAITRISRVELQPNDVIVFESEHPISAEAAKRIQETAEKVWPGRKVVVLAAGMKMKVRSR